MFAVRQALPRILQFQAVLPMSLRYFSASSTNATMNPDVQSILSFWFDGNVSDSTARWFQPPPGFDQEVSDRFGTLIRKARTTDLDSWRDEAKSSLALIILLDQFPRNVFRGTPDSFSSDAKALDTASRGIIRGFDREIDPLQQMFYYLPFVHTESLPIQVAGISLVEGALGRLQPGTKEADILTQSHAFAKIHAVPIAKFGRFPSRNVALGRQTTKEEQEFLKEKPNGF